MPPVTAVGIGESLWDVFPDGRELPGGAPLNFTVHAAQLLRKRNEQAAIVSRIGNDARGERIAREVKAAGVRGDFLQLDNSHPTGVSIVHAGAGADDNAYEIVQDAAWDFLEPSGALDELAAGCRVLCFGTLACRREQNREVIEGLVSSASNAIRIFDVNRRQHYYGISMLRRGCALATALKINESELALLADLLKLRGNRSGDYILALFDRFPLDQIMLTRGSKGTVLFTPTARFEAASPPSYPPAGPTADSVGAGDGAAAAFAAGLHAGMEMLQIVHLANHTGAWIASQPGGMPALPDHILDMVPAR